MIQLSVSAALVIFLLWPAGVWLCTWKYLRAYRSGQRIDTLIWLAAWCLIIAMVEWFALACYVLEESVRLSI